jgi:homoserine O-acetyltransferase
MRAPGIALLAWLSLSCPAQELAYHEIRDFRLSSGAVLGSCRLAYRTHGKLNAARDNAVLFPTWFTGSTASLAGLIGPGMLADTSRYFVIAVDALANGVSCSPSLDGRNFPAVSVGDMVRTQHDLVTRRFGLTGLHAVMGISMGGMQTFEWLAAYPGFARRAVPIIGSPRLNSADLLLWNAELSAIEAASDPRQGLAAALRMHEFALRTPAWLAQPGQDRDYPAIDARIKREAASGMAPEDFAAQLRAMIGHDVSRHHGGDMAKTAAAVRAEVLIVVASEDHMVHPEPARAFARLGGFRLLELPGPCGHMAIGCEANRMLPAVHAFLNGR